MTGYELGGDAGELSNLTTAQIGHRNQFDAIFNDIKMSVTTVLGNWDGAGWDEKEGDSRVFDEYYELAQAAFQDLINATDDSASEISSLGRRMQTYFTP